jgi:cysteine desulfurase
LEKIAKEAINNSKEQSGQFHSAKCFRIIFTSGATESINFALKHGINFEKGSILLQLKQRHKAILGTCDFLEIKGVK